MTLEETLEKIHPADETAMEAALAHWNNIAMPLHSLGRLQDTVVRIAGMTGNARVDQKLSHIHISQPTRLDVIAYAGLCL